MADDQRLYRSNETPARGVQARAQSAPSGTDPLAELARLIGQSDPFGEFGREGGRRQAAPAPQVEPAVDWTPQPDAAGAEQPYAEHYATGGHEGAYAAAPVGQEHDPYYPSNAQYAPEEQDFYDDVPPSRRRMGVLVIAGVFALAVVGTAGAFGYRAIFGSSGMSGPPPVIKADATPSKIVPAGAAKDASSKLITDRVNDRARDEKLVSREEKPVDVNDRAMGMTPPPGQVGMQPSAPPTAATGNGILTSEPKKVHTISIRPDGAAMADASPSAPPPAAPPLAVMAESTRESAPPPSQRAVNPPPAPEREAPRPLATRPVPTAQHTASAPAPSNAPLSLNPNAPAPRAAAPMRTASVAPTQLASTTARAGGYAVQVSSQRSEADAQAAFRGLQGKYPNQLGGRQMLIHKIDLGAKGTYYRAMVGPFASASEASHLCSSLKAAGGQCIIQRN